MTNALILGGGAPNATLMAGALVALLEKDVHFEVISTAGAGALVGLLATAPKGRSGLEALRDMPNFGVADSISNAFPVNYKVFQKPGILADWYRQMLMAFPPYAALIASTPKNEWERFTKDWIELLVNSLCPSDLSFDSKGLCAPVPFVEAVIDFEALPGLRQDIYINAYNITERKMEIFGKDQITPAHFRAAFSFPFIYPPTEINGKLYIEGASVDTLNYKSLIGTHPDVDTIVVFDVLGSDKLITPPRNLYDAWVKSIIVPLVEIAQDDTKLFEAIYNKPPYTNTPRKLLKIPFDIPEEHLTQVFDWSYSNLKLMYDIGYQAGLRFYEEHCDELVRYGLLSAEAVAAQR